MKIKIYLFLLVLAISSCKVKKSVIPDETLYNNEIALENKSTKKNEIAPVNPELLTVDEKVSLLSDEASSDVSRYLDVAPERLINEKLYSFVHYWIDVPYLWGGETYSGIDCSSLVQRLYAEVYDVKLPRTSNEMFWFSNVEKFRDKKYLEEGDLIFFRIDKKKTISHVGIYLQNNKFIASGSKGVQIEDINAPYWISTYASCGRVIVPSKE